MKARRTFLRNTALSLLGISQISFRSSHAKELPSLQDLKKAANDDHLFQLIRQSLLLPDGLIYLNTGSLGPATRQVVDQVSTAMHELESNPVVNNWGGLGNRMEAVRSKVADFIGATKEEIILTRNTTEGINLVGSCLDLQPGDEILTTDHEHGGGENGLFYLTETKGAIVKKVEMPLPAESPEQIVELIKNAIGERTKVVMLSHVSTITGMRMPFAAIAALTRPKNILLIADGAQAPGQIKVDVEQLGVDLYASSGHKWLMGPKETGFLYIRKAVQERIQPVFTRGSYNAYSAASGTRNVATIIGLGESLDLQQTIGLEKIEERCRSLAGYCAERLQEKKGLRLISSTHPALNTGIVSVLLDEGISNRTIFEKMREQNVIIKLLPKYNALRFSLHLFNTKEDVNKMMEVLEELM
ncbi:MAG: aminotransferase class V-fold PLP-dependent enzyme [Saprospiraceae bacterium]